MEINVTKKDTSSVINMMEDVVNLKS